MSLQELLDEGTDINWDEVTARLRTHPHEAAEYDSRSSPSPLELALRKDSPPPEVAAVRALVAAHEEALRQVDEFGRSPLHVCCVDGARADIAGILLDAKSELASQQTADGWIPLHFARSEAMAHLLIHAYPSGVLSTDYGGRIPLHFATYRDTPPGVVRLLLKEGMKQGDFAGGALWKSKKKRTPLNIICSQIERAARGNRLPSAWDWEKLTLMLKAATSSGRLNSSNSKFRLLHAAIDFKCTAEIVRYALVQNPDQVKERDGMGRTPLFIAVSSRGTAAEVIEMLLSAFPRASQMADCEGRLPLHAAAEAGVTYQKGLRSVMRARPSALIVRDVASHMHPFMLAAAGDAGETDTDTIYCLLRERPDILTHIILGEADERAIDQAMCKCFAR